MEIGTGDTLMTGEGGSAEIIYGDATAVRVEEKAEVTLGEEAGAKRVHLRSGTIRPRVSRQPPGRPMVFSTPGDLAEVLGTRFALTASPGRTLLEVEEGRVKLTRGADGRSIVVTAGFRAVAAEGEELALHRIGEPVAVAEPTPRPVLEPAPEPPPVEEPAPEPEPKPGPKPAPEEMAIESLCLVSSGTLDPVRGFDPIRDGAVLDLGKLPDRNVNVLARVKGPVVSVTFYLDGKLFNTEKRPPYTLVLDGGKSAGGGVWQPKPGLHTLEAVPYSGEADSHSKPGSGGAGKSLKITFRVIDK
jgi:hypothetical protein